MVEASSLIKVVMLVGFFHGDALIHRETEVTTRADCEAAIVHAAEFNSRTNWFWEEDHEEKVEVMCLPHPDDLEV